MVSNCCLIKKSWSIPLDDVNILSFFHVSQFPKIQESQPDPQDYKLDSRSVHSSRMGHFHQSSSKYHNNLITNKGSKLSKERSKMSKIQESRPDPL